MLDILKKTAIFCGSAAILVILSSLSLIALVSTGVVSPHNLRPNSAADSLVASSVNTTTAAPTTQTAAPSTTATKATVTSTTATTAEITVKTTTTTAKMQPPSSLNGNEVVAYAQQFLGTPYVYGGNDLGKGIDCSGFTQQVYAHFGISLPRTAGAQFRLSERGIGEVISVYDVAPGDLCVAPPPLFTSKYTGHAAIYMGDSKVIHAYPEEGVIITEINVINSEYVYYRLFNNTAA